MEPSQQVIEEHGGTLIIQPQGNHTKPTYNAGVKPTIVIGYNTTCKCSLTGHIMVALSYSFGQTASPAPICKEKTAHHCSICRKQKLTSFCQAFFFFFSHTSGLLRTIQKRVAKGSRGLKGSGQYLNCVADCNNIPNKIWRAYGKF